MTGAQCDICKDFLPFGLTTEDEALRAAGWESYLSGLEFRHCCEREACREEARKRVIEDFAEEAA